MSERFAKAFILSLYLFWLGVIWIVERIEWWIGQPCPGRSPTLPCLWCDCPRVREYLRCTDRGEVTE